ncbi:MAG TPA: hypothetical protein GX503_01190 [Clostridiales bacterium]|nr:hypothetical protein [Clostridiales bacterium]
MFPGDRDIDVTKNIKMIEWLKSELLTTIASLYHILAKGLRDSHDALVDVLANIILVTYLLGRRLGISFRLIDVRVHEKIRLGILENHQLEEWYGDLSELKQYLDKDEN